MMHSEKIIGRVRLDVQILAFVAAAKAWVRYVIWPFVSDAYTTMLCPSPPAGKEKKKLSCTCEVV